MYGTKDAERADEYESLNGHLKVNDGIDEVLGALGVHLVEILDMQTLGCTCRMDDVVELVSLQLAHQFRLGGEVEVDEMDALVLQVFLGTGRSYRRPCLHALPQGFLNDETTYETRRTGY